MVRLLLLVLVLAASDLACTAQLSTAQLPTVLGGKKFCAHDQKGGQVCFASEGEREQYFRKREQTAALEQRSVEAERKRGWAEQAERDRVREELRRKEADAKRDTERLELAERNRLHQEAKQAKQDETDRRTEQLKAWSAEKTYAVPAISALICEHEQSLAARHADLRREQKIETIGGVSNYRDRRLIAEGIQSDREAIAQWQAYLREQYKAERKPCGALQAILACRADASACDGPGRDQADVAGYLYATLR